MLITRNLHMKRSKVSIKTRSTPASLTFKGQATKHTTVKWSIGHFGKYHNTLCLSPQILHKHCFCFLLGPLSFPRETGNNAYAKFGGTNKEYYGIFRSGLLCTNQCDTLGWGVGVGGWLAIHGKLTP